MIMTVVTMIFLAVVYYYAWRFYLRMAPEWFPNAKWDIIRKPSFLQFAIVAILVTLFFRNLCK